MKRRIEQRVEQGKDNRDGKDNVKNPRNEPDKGEAINSDQSNQTNELNPDIDAKLTVEDVETEEGTSGTRKKKARTSWVFKGNHFNIRLSNDQKTEYAHCCYCSRYK